MVAGTEVGLVRTVLGIETASDALLVGVLAVRGHRGERVEMSILVG